MLRAQGYTPAIIYVEAGVAITKHMVVRMTPGSLVVPSDPSSDTRAIGFALQDAAPGEFIPVQTDGVIYDWSGQANLVPGREYYQAQGGDISLSAAADGAWIVGVAVNSTTFQIRIGSGGISSSNDSFNLLNEYIYISQADVDNKYIELSLPFYDIEECLFVVLGGGSLFLIPGIDYSLTKSNPSSYVYDRVSWDNLPNSILHRALSGDIITLTKKGLEVIESSPTVVLLSDGVVIAETEAKLLTFQNGVSIGTETALTIKTFN